MSSQGFLETVMFKNQVNVTEDPKINGNHPAFHFIFCSPVLPLPFLAKTLPFLLCITTAFLG